MYRATDNPNDITVTHEFASLEAAQAFAGSEELHGTMANAGVAGETSLTWPTGGVRTAPVTPE